MLGPIKTIFRQLYLLEFILARTPSFKGITLILNKGSLFHQTTLEMKKRCQIDFCNIVHKSCTHIIKMIGHINRSGKALKSALDPGNFFLGAGEPIFFCPLLTFGLRPSNPGDLFW
jgi:hypothetical protein